MTTISKPNPFTGAGGSSSTTVSPAKRLYIELQKYKKLQIETDMRAMNNPTRMNVIEILAKKLVTRIMDRCPECTYPGFGEMQPVGKLLCGTCGEQTNLYAQQKIICKYCNYNQIKKRPDGLETSPPDYCNYCNP